MSSSDITSPTNAPPRRGPSPMMMVSIIVGTVVACALIVVVSIITGGSTAPTNALDGTSLTAFTLPGITSGTVQAPWAKGHPTVVVFFASWCPGCRTEMPRIAAYAASHNLGNVRVMGIDANDVQPAGLIFTENAHVNFPVGVDKYGPVTSGTFHLGNLPDTVFVDGNGLVNEVVQGPISNNSLAAGIAALS